MANPAQPQRVSRTELYEKVWSKSVQHVAAECAYAVRDGLLIQDPRGQHQAPQGAKTAAPLPQPGGAQSAARRREAKGRDYPPPRGLRRLPRPAQGRAQRPDLGEHRLREEGAHVVNTEDLTTKSGQPVEKPA